MSQSFQNLWIAGYPFFRSWLTLVGTEPCAEAQQARIVVYDADGGECYREELALRLGDIREIAGADLLMAAKLESGLKHGKVVISRVETSAESLPDAQSASLFGYTQFMTAEGARPYLPAVHRVRSHAGAYFPVLFGQRVSSLLTVMNCSLDAVMVSVWIDNLGDTEPLVLAVPGLGTRIVSLADEFLTEEAREVVMAPLRIKAKRPGVELEVAVTEIITGQLGLRLAGIR